ncbi:DUF3040 domain-containing protein [Catenulispora sp. NF23]|uniref:DUF3040 domain-containing protein n=1 Tax=Catenulispora pinistramenti TaxID=2705254 RepID=A0ABS5KJW2_9ACTN|nr:DUF3040 domain-containing protein [Catenulispora pinistramenti]MBS2538686.1 DUF3040 domain-containing protein [Catenulispora pinistramenti]MBS2545839.1 DUF3040 domain-containing protein [Catenulispora pinistramenti]
MPLSDHEQRLLEQMERALHAEDPKFASALQGADLRALFRRRALLAVIGFVLGVGMLVAGVVISQIALSVAGFVVMLACAWLTYASWRRIPAPGEIVPIARRRARAVTGKGGGRQGRQGRQAKQPTMRRFEERWQRRRDEGNM